MISKDKLTLTGIDVSENYEHVVAKYGGDSFDCVKFLGRRVCVLPFTTDSSGKHVDGLFLNKYYDFFSDITRMSVVMPNVLGDDESCLDAVIRWLGEYMDVPIYENNLDRMFFLGTVEFNRLLMAEIPCYGINVTGLAKKQVYEIDANADSILSHVPYVSVLRSTSQDAMLAVSTFMLISYMSE